MRAVILGTDFVKDTDGSFKTIETNTNVGLQVDATKYFNINEFDTFLTENNLNEVVVVYNLSNMQINRVTTELQENNPTYSKSDKVFYQLLKEYYSGSSVSISQQVVNDTSVTIPNVTDSPNKLILRVAYDTTSLIDDVYARDNWEFLKLMNDSNPNSIPKTYIDDVELGFDSIGNTLRDNGNHPNYCIKKRITPTNNNLYPKLLKITSVEQLQTIKQNLDADEYLQEYIFNGNDLLYNKTKVYRSIDLVYGGALDVLNLWVMEHTNILDTITIPDYDDNNSVQIWDRNSSKTNDIAVKLSADEGTKILDINGNIILAENLAISDLVKTIDFPNIQYDIPEFTALEWTGSVSDILNQSYTTSSTVQSIIQSSYFGEIVEIELNNGSTFSDVPHALILMEVDESGSNFAQFCSYDSLKTGSNVFVWDTQTNQMITTSIVNKYYSYQQLNAYTINLNDFDLFLTLEESSTNRYGLVTHNFDFDCIAYTCPGYSTAQYLPANTCYDCATGTFGGTPPASGLNRPANSCSSVGECCRVGGQYIGQNPGTYQCQYWGAWGCAVGNTIVETGGYCNQSKPSDVGLKTNINYLDVTTDGLKLYSFEYKDKIKTLWKDETNESLDGVWIGVMAQDLIGTKYESALWKHKEGFYVIDYTKLPNIQKI